MISSGKFDAINMIIKLDIFNNSTFKQWFRGGLLPKRLYEVYGESGTGKTQFAI